MLVYPGCQMSTVHGMIDLLTVASSFSSDQGGPHLYISTWHRHGDAFVRVDDAGNRDLPTFMIVPGRLSPPARPDEAAPFVAWLRDLHEKGTTLVSSCNGAFLLAYAGLLNGRPATTHWQFANIFRDAFPDVQLDVDRIVIEDGDILTAGGLMAWTDLGLRLVERTLGPGVMIETSKFMLLDPLGREQRHYGKFLPRLSHGDSQILKAQVWLEKRNGRAATIVQMAEIAGLEERTFLRRFKVATGLKPTEYTQHLRINRARDLLETTGETIDQVAWSVGYENTAAFRRVFHRLIGLSAGEYRNRFASHGRSAIA